MPPSFLPLAAATSLEAAGAAIEHAIALIQGAYVRAPTLMLALTALLVLPGVALISAGAQVARGYRRRRAALRTAERGADPGALIGDLPDATGLPVRSQAWLTVERAGGTVALTGQVVRMGRHRDNDIRLTDRSVHRHHAVIERTPDETFVIADVSGKGGSGVLVNGLRTERAQLSDGDVIALGRARLRFETIRHEDIPAGSAHPVEVEG
jgi:hypothetical protein